MKQKATELALFGQRLERLERENRRLRRGFVAVSLGLGTSLVLGLTSTPGLRPTLGFGMGYGVARQTHAVGPPGAPQDFVLRDSRGVTRARLDANGTALTFFDYHGAVGGTLNLETGMSVSASAPRHIRQVSTPAMAYSVSPRANPIRQPDSGEAETPSAVRNPFIYSFAAAGLAKTSPARPARASPPTGRPISESPVLIAQLGVPSALPKMIAAASPAGSALVPLVTPTLDTMPVPTSVTAAATVPYLPPAPAAVPLPQMTLKVVGYVENPGERRSVVVSDGIEVHVVHQGDMFDERYKVVRVEPGVIEIDDTANQQTLNLPINP